MAEAAKPMSGLSAPPGRGRSAAAAPSARRAAAATIERGLDVGFRASAARPERRAEHVHRAGGRGVAGDLRTDAVPAPSDASCGTAPLRRIDRLCKRCLDVAVAAMALAVLAVPLAIVALLVKLTSRGPVFYRQTRMGRNGMQFTILKFRSMHRDAERATGPVWAQSDDQRVTRLGRHLRRLDLDELPQLWNILRGDMSLVGPRPERPYFVCQFQHHIPRYMLRHRATPGLTGWAQVHGWRGDTAVENRIAHDLDYIEN